MAALLFAFARPLIELFDPTPQVVDIGAECLRAVTPALIPAIVGLVLARGFDEAGDTAPAMVINLLTLWGLEVSFAYGLAGWLDLGLTGSGWARLWRIWRTGCCSPSGSVGDDGSGGYFRR